MFFEVTMQDAWVWDMYRPARFVKNVRVVTFKDVNVEELAKSDLEVPRPSSAGRLTAPAAISEQSTGLTNRGPVDPPARAACPRRPVHSRR